MPPRHRARILPRLLVCTALLHLVARKAGADEIDCDARYSLFRPTPDLCLGPIETDRPHLTETPHPVAAGRVQLESGLVLLDLFGRHRDRVLFFENIYKVGLVTGVDLELLHTHLVAAAGTLSFAREEPMAIRAKAQVLAADGLLPALTLVPILGVPLDGDEALEPGLLIFAAWELPRGMEVEVNVGGTLLARAPVRGVSPLAAVALTTPVWGPLGAYGEVFSVGPHAPGDRWDVLTGGGLTFLAHRDLQLDTGAWVGLTGDVSPIIPFVGVSVRR